MSDKDRISEYVADYEIDGDDGYYIPNEHERFLIEDALRGFELIESVRLTGVEAEKAKLQQQLSEANEKLDKARECLKSVNRYIRTPETTYIDDVDEMRLLEYDKTMENYHQTLKEVE